LPVDHLAVKQAEPHDPRQRKPTAPIDRLRVALRCVRAEHEATPGREPAPTSGGSRDRTAQGRAPTYRDGPRPGRLSGGRGRTRPGFATRESVSTRVATV